MADRSAKRLRRLSTDYDESDVADDFGGGNKANAPRYVTCGLSYTPTLQLPEQAGGATSGGHQQYAPKHTHSFTCPSSTHLHRAAATPAVLCLGDAPAAALLILRSGA